MENKELEFAFQKKIAIYESFDIFKNTRIVFEAFQRLFQCMKETNDIHKVSCEYFRLDFRPQTLHEQITGQFPMDMTVLDLKWGSKKELEKIKYAND